MSGITTEVVPYKGWKRNLRVTNGDVELIVTLDVGPRVIRCGFVGQPNFFGEIATQLGKSRERTWMIRGGHRLWVAPEHKPRTYELDNEPVESVRTTRAGLRVTQKPGRMTGLRKTMEITLPKAGGRVSVLHTLTNAGRKPVSCSAWGLSVMPVKGTAIVPLPKLIRHDESCRPNQNWSLWGYTDLTDARVRVEKGALFVNQKPRATPFKIGLAEREGWAAYLREDRLFLKLFKHDEAARYPDGNVNLEVYTDATILELETLGPVRTISPGQSVTHREEWLLFRDFKAPRDTRKLMKRLERLAAGA